jgi:hypothetical protein
MKTNEVCDTCGCSPCDCKEKDAYKLTNKTIKLLGPAKQHARAARKAIERKAPTLSRAADLIAAAKTPCPYPRDISAADLYAKMGIG